MTTKKKLWCFHDTHSWGVMLSQAAAARGYDAHLFEDPREPDEGHVFMHMHHHPSVRLVHKRAMALMATNPDLTLVPNYRSSVLYDDKLEQLRQFAKWMPRTHVFYTPSSAKKFLATEPKFPFVSKSLDGASANNVRLLETVAQAQDEVRCAFSDIGIKTKYGQEQRSYLMWQTFVPNNVGDIRVIAIGDKRLMLHRINRPDRPMASGSGNLVPITKPSVDDLGALAFANRFFSCEAQSWCGIDIVKDHVTGQWRLLETTVGWTLHGYYECAFLNIDGSPSGPMGNQVWNVFLDELEAGKFT